MPEPIHLHRRLPAHLAAPPASPPETNVERRERQLGLTRELTDLNMLAARDAAHRIATRDPDAVPDGPASADPTLALARATRAVTLLIAHENRIAAGEQSTPFSVDDPRALALRQLLHPLLAAEPDPARRRATRLRINLRIDDAMAADLDDDVPLAQIAKVIANENGLSLDLAKIPDAFLEPGFTPAAPAAAPVGTADPAPRFAVYRRPEADTPDQR